MNNFGTTKHVNEQLGGLFGTISEPKEVTEPETNKNIFEPYKNAAEFIRYFSEDYALRKIFHSKLKVGDVVKFDTSKLPKWDNRKKLHKKDGKIISLSNLLECCDVTFDNEKEFFFITENIIEVNGKEYNYKNCIKELKR